MTFAQQFKEEYKQEFMSTLAPQIRQEGRLEGAQDKARVIAKKMLNTGKDWNDIKEFTGFSDQALRGLEKECLANESSCG